MTRSTTVALRAQPPATASIAQATVAIMRAPLEPGVPGSAAKNADRADLLTRSLERVMSVPLDGGPLASSRQVVQEIAEHLRARWVILALRPGAMPGTTVRLVGRDPGGRMVTDPRSLPAHIRSAVQWAWVNARSTVLGVRELYVPLVVRGRSQGVVAAVQDDIDGGVLDVDELDVRAVTILASQAVVSLHHDDVLHRRERTLFGHHQKVVAAERRRLANELHDTVARQILSAGMTVEHCRSEVAVGTALHDQLGHASRLARAAVHHLRASIHVLGTSPRLERDLPAMVRQLARLPATQPLDVTVEVRGDVVTVPTVVTSAVLRIVGECLFNAVIHGRARRAAVSLRYRVGDLLVAVGDDGEGDPAVVRRLADSQASATAGGYHRGLADIAGVVECLEGELEVGRSDLGGVRVHVQLPIRADGLNRGEAAHG